MKENAQWQIRNLFVILERAFQCKGCQSNQVYNILAKTVGVLLGKKGRVEVYFVYNIPARPSSASGIFVFRIGSTKKRRARSRDTFFIRCFKKRNFSQNKRQKKYFDRNFRTGNFCVFDLLPQNYVLYLALPNTTVQIRAHRELL